MFNRAGIFCGHHWYQMRQLCRNSQYQNSDFFIIDFFKKHLSVNYSVGELGFQLIYAEKLVKLNWLRVLHHVRVFWRVFFREKLMSLNWLRLLHQIILFWRVFPQKNSWNWIGYNSYTIVWYFDKIFGLLTHAHQILARFLN